MKRNTTLSLACAALSLLAMASAATLPAQSSEIKARMDQRLPLIMELKAKGLIGEDSQGFLQFVGSSREKEDAVNAENADRRLVYEQIAKQQKTTPQLVGQRRAIQIAANAKSGEWLQDSSGKWAKKP